MILEKWINKNKLTPQNIGRIPNKRLSKIFKQYKYIDFTEYWYDSNNSDENNWIDVEGIGYGWIWLNYKNSHKLQRKAIIKFVNGVCRKENLWTYQKKGIKYYIFWTGCSIVMIRLSDNKLRWI